MRAGRADYDEMIKVRSLHPGEPFFVVRAQDEGAGDTVRAWCAIDFAKGAPLALIEQGLQQADAIDAFGPKKVPDADHLTDAEQKQLVYQLERRAWNRRNDSPTEALLLAHVRGRTEGLAEARSKPIDMVLHCPGCGVQHIDSPYPAKGWTNPPHRSHLCHGCGLVWRPADIPTNGVQAVRTTGKEDAPRDLWTNARRGFGDAIGEPYVVPTHQHADGGLYEFVEFGAIKGEEGWGEAAFYRGQDGQLRATTKVRWANRFSLITSEPPETTGYIAPVEDAAAHPFAGGGYRAPDQQWSETWARTDAEKGAE